MGNTFEGFGLSHAAILDGETGAEEVDGDIYGVRTASLAPDTGNFDNTGDDTIRSSWFWLNFATVTVESGYVPFNLLTLLGGGRVTSTGVSSIVFTPAAQVASPYNYTGGGNSDTFTVDTKTVTLDQNYQNAAGVAAAIQTQLGATHKVYRFGNQVRIESAAASTTPIAVAGTDAAAVTGSANYLATTGVGSAAAAQSVPLWSASSMNAPPRPMLIRVPSKDEFGNVYVMDFVLYKVQFSPIGFTGPAYRAGLVVNYSGRALLSAYDEKGDRVYDANGCPDEQVGRIISHSQVVC